MRKIYIAALIIGLALVIGLDNQLYAFRGSGWSGGVDTTNVTFQTYITNHAGSGSSEEIGESTDVARTQIRDTVNTWWGDTAAVYGSLSELGDSANAARSNARDSVNAWWSDSTSAVLGYISDTAVVYQGYISDTAVVYQGYIGDTAAVVRGNISDTAVVYQGYIGDTAAVVRAEIPESIAAFTDTLDAHPATALDFQAIDSLQIPQWASTPSTGVSGLFGMDSVGDTVWAYFPGGKQAVYPQATAGAMSGTDILDSLNDATRSVTQTWEWDGGNIIAADGQKLLWTDDAETDSGSIYDDGDTSHITSDNIIRVGGAGATKILDSLIIPTYAAFPATGSEGLFGVDSANDSLIAYWGAARRQIYPRDPTFNVKVTCTDSLDVEDAILRDDTVLIAAPVQNLFIGKEAGLNITGAASNTFLGWQAGKAVGNGSYNTYVGRFCMPVDTAGTYNVVIGNEAGTSAKEIDYSVIIGSQAGLDVIIGGSNTLVGSNAGQNTTGQDNTYIGRDAGRGSDGQASYNTGIGYQSCYADSSGDYNTALGWQALYSNVVGHTNVAIGAQAGYSNTSNYSVFIGKQAGYSETGAEKLYIENSNADTTAALIFGDFSTNFLLLNAKVKVDSLEVGPAGATITKIVKVGSHLAIILSGADTLWAAADTTNF